MNILAVGLDYKKADASLRELVALDTNAKKIHWGSYILQQGHREVLFLSTCNRTEIYLATDLPQQGERDLIGVFQTLSGQEDIHFTLNLWQEAEAVEHLFQVAAGFDSMILGEDQILGQVKSAMEFAIEHQFSGKLLNKLFREAVTFSKKIRHRSGLSEHPVSTCYAGIRLLKSLGAGLSGQTVLITGAGNMGGLALRHVLEEHPKRVFMTNRRHDNLLAFLKDFRQVLPIAYEKRYEALSQADVLISATASPHVIFASEKVEPRNKPLMILDLAIPRDVDAALGERENITLLGVDDLRQVVDENLERRRSIMEEWRTLLHKEVGQYLQWKKASRLDPLLDYVNDRCAQIHQDTLEYLKDHTDLSPEQLEEIGHLLNGQLKQSFAKPILRMKQPEQGLSQYPLAGMLEGFWKGQGR